MKSRILSYCMLITLSIVFLSSCSQKVARVSQMDLMENAQALKTDPGKCCGNTVKTPAFDTRIQATDSKEVSAYTAHQNSGMTKQNTMNNKHQLLSRNGFKKSVFPVHEVTQIPKQLAQNPLLIKKSNLMSYNQVNLSGNLRLGIIFIIIALLVGILTVIPGLGLLFGILASILFIIGIIFIILWLLEYV
jgi:PBP1b-binding outer membrane lipoprotein LpoB